MIQLPLKACLAKETNLFQTKIPHRVVGYGVFLFKKMKSLIYPIIRRNTDIFFQWDEHPYECNRVLHAVSHGAKSLHDIVSLTCLSVDCVKSTLIDLYSFADCFNDLAIYNEEDHDMYGEFQLSNTFIDVWNDYPNMIPPMFENDICKVLNKRECVLIRNLETFGAEFQPSILRTISALKKLPQNEYVFDLLCKVELEKVILSK